MFALFVFKLDEYSVLTGIWDSEQYGRMYGSSMGESMGVGRGECMGATMLSYYVYVWELLCRATWEPAASMLP